MLWKWSHRLYRRFWKCLDSLIPTAVLFHSNEILSFRSDDCRVKLRAALFNVLSGTLSSIRTNFLQCEFHMMGWGGMARRLKKLRGRVESIKWHSELRNFSLPRIHSSLGIPPGLCQDCWKSLEICPAATSSFLSPLPQYMYAPARNFINHQSTNVGQRVPRYQ